MALPSLKSMRMGNNMRLTLIALACLSLTACASVPRQHDVNVLIDQYDEDGLGDNARLAYSKYLYKRTSAPKTDGWKD